MNSNDAYINVPNIICTCQRPVRQEEISVMDALKDKDPLSDIEIKNFMLKYGISRPCCMNNIFNVPVYARHPVEKFIPKNPEVLNNKFLTLDDKNFLDPGNLTYNDVLDIVVDTLEKKNLTTEYAPILENIAADPNERQKIRDLLILNNEIELKGRSQDPHQIFLYKRDIELIDSLDTMDSVKSSEILDEVYSKYKKVFDDLPFEEQKKFVSIDERMRKYSEIAASPSGPSETDGPDGDDNEDNEQTDSPEDSPEDIVIQKKDLLKKLIKAIENRFLNSNLNSMMNIPLSMTLGLAQVVNIDQNYDIQKRDALRKSVIWYINKKNLLYDLPVERQNMDRLIKAMIGTYLLAFPDIYPDTPWNDFETFMISNYPRDFLRHEIDNLELGQPVNLVYKTQLISQSLKRNYLDSLENFNKIKDKYPLDFDIADTTGLSVVGLDLLGKFQRNVSVFLKNKHQITELSTNWANGISDPNFMRINKWLQDFVYDFYNYERIKLIKKSDLSDKDIARLKLINDLFPLVDDDISRVMKLSIPKRISIFKNSPGVFRPPAMSGVEKLSFNKLLSIIENDSQIEKDFIQNYINSEIEKFYDIDFSVIKVLMDNDLQVAVEKLKDNVLGFDNLDTDFEAIDDRYLIDYPIGYMINRNSLIDTMKNLLTIKPYDERFLALTFRYISDPENYKLPTAEGAILDTEEDKSD